MKISFFKKMRPLICLCLLFCACAGAAQGEGISSPVAQVSAPYAQDAQKLLDSFYHTQQTVSWDTVDEAFADLNSLERMEQYAYDVIGTSDGFLYFKEAAELLRQGVSFSEICTQSARRIEERLGKSGGIIGVLYCDAADGYTAGAHIAEAVYDVESGSLTEQASWDRGPATALRLDDGLIQRLRDAGLKTGQTKAKSFFLGGYCRGVWFSDGETERFLLQSVTTQSGAAVPGGLCTSEQLCAGLDAHGEYYAYHGTVLGEPVCG